MSIFNLPQEIITFILEQLPFDELISVANTHRLFRSICIRRLNYKRKMHRYSMTIKVIKAFIDDLYVEFDDLPLKRYKRLKVRSELMVRDSINGFKEFFVTCGKNVIYKVPVGTHINYGKSKTVYINIHKFIKESQSNPETLSNIHKHLLFINNHLNYDKRRVLALKKLNETKFHPEQEPIKAINHNEDYGFLIGEFLINNFKNINIVLT